MWTLKKDGRTCGYYDSLPEAVAALAEERMKEDGTDLRIEEEDDDGGPAEPAGGCEHDARTPGA